MAFRNKIKASLSKVAGSGGNRGVVHPADILAELKRTAQREKKHFKDKTFVPDHYAVYLSGPDLSSLGPILDSLKSELVEELNAHFAQKDLQINKTTVSLEIEARLVMRSGNLEVEGRFFEKGEPETPPPKESGEGRKKETCRKIRLIISTGQSRERTVELREGTHVIGRGRDADVVVPKDPLVSKTHLSLRVRHDAVSVRDSGSSNGTFLNSKRITEPSVLESGDRLLLGNTEIKVLW